MGNVTAVLGTVGQTMSSYKCGPDFKQHTTTHVNVLVINKNTRILMQWESAPIPVSGNLKKVQHRPLAFACVYLSYANSYRLIISYIPLGIIACEESVFYL